MAVELRKVETLHRGYTTLMRAILAAPDGKTFWREIEHHGHACAVLPYDAERRCALLVSLPRAPVIWNGGPSELVEAIAGMLDGEPPDACARREAMEEAGVRLGDLEPVGRAYASPGLSTETLQLFLAPYAGADRVEAGGGLADENEHITVLEVPLAELWRWVETERIADLKTLALVFALRVRRPDLFVSDPTRFHTGWLLDAGEREALLRRFPPRYARVVAHHVTLKFGDQAARPPADTVAEVVGVADDGLGVEALVVRIGGTTARPDGSVYHVTWSLEPGHEARESNDVIARHGFAALPSPVPIRLRPKPFGD
jgi:nudix-type nucleoside diphosphatase (YffH/AdpP family)